MIRERLMVVKKIINSKTQRLSKLMTNELGINYNLVWKILKNKDVKVQGRRVSKDIQIENDQLVEVFLQEEQLKVLFENDDIIVVFKPHGIETVNDAGDDLCNLVSKWLNLKIYAVHRLDRNTEGLVIFAKNEQAKNSLDNAIKQRKIKKYYLAEVVGVPKETEKNLIAYLKKDIKNSKVFISNKFEEGFEEIKTNYKIVKNNEEYSILEVELVTGKTHQIRAHLSYIGLPILGDEKYGNHEVNRRLHKKYQCLCAYKLVFHFNQNDYLCYLDDKVVELKMDDINFYKNFK